METAPDVFSRLSRDLLDISSLHDCGFYFRRLGAMWAINASSHQSQRLAAYRLIQTQFPAEALYKVNADTVSLCNMRAFSYFKHSWFMFKPSAQSAREMVQQQLHVLPTQAFEFFFSGLFTGLDAWVVETPVFSFEVAVNLNALKELVLDGDCYQEGSDGYEMIVSCLANLYRSVVYRSRELGPS